VISRRCAVGLLLRLSVLVGLLCLAPVGTRCPGGEGDFERAKAEFNRAKAEAKKNTAAGYRAAARAYSKANTLLKDAPPGRWRLLRGQVLREFTTLAAQARRLGGEEVKKWNEVGRKCVMGYPRYFEPSLDQKWTTWASVRRTALDAHNGIPEEVPAADRRRIGRLFNDANMSEKKFISDLTRHARQFLERGKRSMAVVMDRAALRCELRASALDELMRIPIDSILWYRIHAGIARNAMGQTNRAVAQFDLAINWFEADRRRDDEAIYPLRTHEIIVPLRRYAYLFKAEAYRDGRQWDKMKATIEKMRGIWPGKKGDESDRKVQVYLVEHLAATDKKDGVKRALKELQRILKQKSDGPAAALARELLRKLMPSDPSDIEGVTLPTDLYYEVAGEARRAGKHDVALRHYRKVIEATRRRGTSPWEQVWFGTRGWYWMGKCYQKQGRGLEAAVCFETVLDRFHEKKLPRTITSRREYQKNRKRLTEFVDDAALLYRGLMNDYRNETCNPSDKAFYVEVVLEKIVKLYPDKAPEINYFRYAVEEQEVTKIYEEDYRRIEDVEQRLQMAREIIIPRYLAVVEKYKAIGRNTEHYLDSRYKIGAIHVYCMNILAKFEREDLNSEIQDLAGKAIVHLEEYRRLLANARVPENAEERARLEKRKQQITQMLPYCYFNQKKYEKALGCFKEWLRKNPGAEAKEKGKVDRKIFACYREMAITKLAERRIKFAVAFEAVRRAEGIALGQDPADKRWKGLKGKALERQQQIFMSYALDIAKLYKDSVLPRLEQEIKAESSKLDKLVLKQKREQYEARETKWFTKGLGGAEEKLFRFLWYRASRLYDQQKLEEAKVIFDKLITGIKVKIPARSDFDKVEKEIFFPSSKPTTRRWQRDFEQLLLLVHPVRPKDAEETPAPDYQNAVQLITALVGDPNARPRIPVPPEVVAMKKAAKTKGKESPAEWLEKLRGELEEANILLDSHEKRARCNRQIARRAELQKDPTAATWWSEALADVKKAQEYWRNVPDLIELEAECEEALGRLAKDNSLEAFDHFLNAQALYTHLQRFIAERGEGTHAPRYYDLARKRAKNLAQAARCAPKKRTKRQREEGIPTKKDLYLYAVREPRRMLESMHTAIRNWPGGRPAVKKFVDDVVVMAKKDGIDISAGDVLSIGPGKVLTDLPTKQENELIVRITGLKRDHINGNITEEERDAKVRDAIARHLAHEPPFPIGTYTQNQLFNKSGLKITPELIEQIRKEDVPKVRALLKKFER